MLLNYTVFNKDYTADKLEGSLQVGRSLVQKKKEKKRQTKPEIHLDHAIIIFLSPPVCSDRMNTGISFSPHFHKTEDRAPLKSDQQ